MATGRSVDYYFGRRDAFTQTRVNQIFSDIDRRLNGAEALATVVDRELGNFLQDALLRLDATVVSTASKFQRLAEHGFLIAESDTSVTLTAADTPVIVIPEGDERELFTPSEFVMLTRKANTTDYAILRTMSYDRETGEYQGEIISVAGNPGPFTDWELSSVAGSTIAVRSMLEQVETARSQVVADAAQVASDRAFVEGIADEIQEGAVISVNGQTGVVTITASGIGAAPVNSPTFTGSPAAPTPASNSNSTRIATTSFVQTLVGAKANSTDVYTRDASDEATISQTDFYG